MKNLNGPIKFNDSPENLKDLQTAMESLGYSASPFMIVNENIRALLLQQVKVLQKDLKIHNPDGKFIADKKTIKAINKKLKELDLLDGTNDFKITGSVISNSGVPFPKENVSILGIDVKAIGLINSIKSIKVLKSTKEVKEIKGTVTEEDGTYTLDFVKNFKNNGGIIVVAFKGDRIDGVSQLIPTSILEKYNDFSNLNIIIGKDIKGKSEYKKLLESVNSYLKNVNLEFKDIYGSSEQINFIAYETKLSSRNLTLLVTADELAQDVQDKNLFREIFYGLGRQGIELNWNSFYIKKDGELKSAIADSFNQNIVGEINDKYSNSYLTRIKFDTLLENLQITSSLKVLEDKPDGKQLPLKDFLNYALKTNDDNDDKLKFLASYRQFTGTPPEFWKKLKDDGFNDVKIKSLQFTNQLTKLTGSYQPLVKGLSEIKKINSPEELINSPEELINSPEELLSLSDNEWNTVLDNTGFPGKDENQKADGNEEKKRVENNKKLQEVYKSILKNILNTVYPTKVIALNIDNGIFKDTLLNDPNIKDGLSKFLKTGKFDFSKRFDKDSNAELTNITGNDTEKYKKIKDELYKLQRIYVVSISPEVMSKLIELNLDSAYKISNFPEKIFINRYSNEFKNIGGDEALRAVHQRASFIRAMSEHSLMAAYELGNLNVPSAILDSNTLERFRNLTSGRAVAMSLPITGATAGSSSASSETLNELIPNYSNLFGNPDICECAHCSSIYSPASYFVELLQFLKFSGKIDYEDNPPALINNPLNPLNILLRRRPDLEHILLSCENTETPMPYIDLVNEIMEYYVANQKLDVGAAHNNIDITSKELRADPQFTIKEAYKILSNSDPNIRAVYPFTLPYHHPLDIIRTYLNKLNKTTRYEILDIMRNDSSDKFTKALYSEYLELSEEEYKIITKENFDSNHDATNVEIYYGYLDSATLNNSISNVREFLRRSGLKYVELIQLVETRFINPDQDLLFYIKILFEHSGISAKALYDGMRELSIENDIPDIQNFFNDAARYNDFKGWIKINFNKIKGIITLFHDNNTCNLDETYIRTIEKVILNPTPPESGITDDIWSKLHRFIRLWKKLGCEIHELDVILKSLGENDIAADTIKKLFFVKKINEERIQNQQPLKLQLLQLATFWGEIDTVGKKSLYARLFLNKSIQKIDEDFKLKDGKYIVTGKLLNQKIPYILAALSMSSEDLNRIEEDIKILNPAFSIAGGSPLNLLNLSAIYRYKVLSKALKIPIKDLITLKKLLNIHPFSKFNPANNRFIDQNPKDTFNFIETAMKVKSSGFKVELLDYIINGNLNPERPISLSEEKILQTIKSIKDGLNKIEVDYPDNYDLTQVTEDQLRSAMTILFQPVIVEKIISIINDTLQFTAVSAPNLNIAIPGPLSSKIQYKKSKGTLSCAGILQDFEKTDLLALGGDGTRLEFQNAVNSLYNQPDNFLDEAFSGIFENANMPDAKKILLNHPAPTNKYTIQEKFKFFFQYLMPFLKNRLRENTIVQNISVLIGLDEPTTNALIQSDMKSFYENIIATGLTGNYFNNITFTAPSDTKTDNEINFDRGNNSPNPNVAQNNFSIRWEGWICPPVNDEYTFILEKKEMDESVKLFLEDSLVVESPLTNINLSVEYSSDLRAGKLYKIRVEYIQTGGESGVKLFWQTPTMPKEIVPASALFPKAQMESVIDLNNKYHKAAMFINGFKLKAEEIAHLIKYEFDFNNINFKTLSFPHWIRINDYSKLRDSIPEVLGKLIDIFTLANRLNPTRNPVPPPVPDELIQLTSIITSWNTDILRNLANDRFKLTINSLKNEKELIRLQLAVKLLIKVGASYEDVSKWADAASNFDVLNDIAQSIKQTVKSKYDEEAWLETAKDMSNKIRENQKQALIQFLMQRKELQDWGVTDADGLFQYFLIDVQMSSCLDTSRIRQAISSVQLFITRILLNLENNRNPNENISPDAVDRSRWEWMKLYRVWEANRKIFCYPENWLEPEWRDDRSQFFKEFESELLQNDITERNVGAAFRNYLRKLNEVSNLDIFGMYQDLDGEADIKVHVFGRTHATPYQYYYRALNESGYWSAWEKVQLDIKSIENGERSGVHLIPVVWKKRLFLFWPEFTEKLEDVDPNATININSNGLGENDSTDTDSDGGDTVFNPPDVGGSDNGNLPRAGNENNFVTRRKTKEIGNSNSISRLTVNGSIPDKYWEIRLAWSEYIDGKWSPKKLSKEFLTPGNEYMQNGEDVLIRKHFNSSLSFEGQYHFKVNFIDDELKITFSKNWGDFNLSDIENNIILTYEKVLNPFPQPQKPQPGRDSYDPFYMSYGTVGKLVLKTNEYLKKNLKHRIIYSDQLTDFETTINYPFFFSGANRIYYVTAETDIEYTRRVFHEIQFPESSFFNLGGYFLPPSRNKKSGFSLPFSGNDVLIVDSIGFYETITQQGKGLKFYTFYHPFAGDFLTRLNNEKGMEELMGLDTDTEFQTDNLNNPAELAFVKTFVPNFDFNFVSPKPSELGDKTYYLENIDYEISGAYSIYNWELFFHAPLFIATRLSKNGKYEEAMKWFHYIFDPTTDEAPEPGKETKRFWKVLPFRNAPQENLAEYFRRVAETPTEVEPLIEEWRDNPFKPFLIARNRPMAFMKNVVMKYVENLIAWGDDLFRRDIMESINEATQLYVIASHILGPKPESVPQSGNVKPETYNSLKIKLDAFGNAIINMENIFPNSSVVTYSPESSGTPNLLGMGNPLYFCIPNNEKLLKYWETVEDRLFKIRHCMNIEGVERTLALFEPPIDPALLVKAFTQGLSLGSILSDLSTPAPIYRFQYLLQRANDFCNEVKSLGNAVLSAIEKKDGEELSRMRASQETTMLELITGIRERQILEAKANLDNLNKTRQSIIFRLKHYLTLMGNDDVKIPDLPEIPSQLTNETPLPPDTIIPEFREDVDVSLVANEERGIKLIPREQEEMTKSEDASSNEHKAAYAMLGIEYIAMIPNYKIATMPMGTGSELEIQTGGTGLSVLARAVSNYYNMEASIDRYKGTKAAKLASYIRREQDWNLQANLTAKEIIQLDKQITAAQIRVQIAEKELDNHLKQIENSKQVENYLQSKFTNQELYQWMKEQLFSVYKQSYNLAYDMAKKVEKAYKYEIGNEEISFIEFGYWDSTYQGLVAGDKLGLALKQMEKSYLEQNKREFEITKHVSLLFTNPLALQQLKETGTCNISLPEELFDLDYPGHYFRRIKSVSISIPCIVGPYTSVNCTLRLLKNTIRINTLDGDDVYQHNNDEGVWMDDARFRSSNVPVKSIATSNAQNDAGMFELNFRDERYLPFEGAGVISDWKIELNGKYIDSNGDSIDVSQFDFNTISDVIIRLSYTSREDAELKLKAIDNINNFVENAATLVDQPFIRLFSLKHEFSTEWYNFLNPTNANVDNELKFTLEKNRFPFFAQNKNLNISKINLLIKRNGSDEYRLNIKVLNENSNPSSKDFDLKIPEDKYGHQIFMANYEPGINELDISKEITVKVGKPARASAVFKINPDEIEDIIFVLQYSISSI